MDLLILCTHDYLISNDFRLEANEEKVVKSFENRNVYSLNTSDRGIPIQTGHNSKNQI